MSIVPPRRKSATVAFAAALAGLFCRAPLAGPLVLGEEFQVNQTTDVRDSAPATAMSAGGDFVVAWQTFSVSTIPTIYARLYDRNGQPRGPNFAVNTTNTRAGQNSPDVAMDAEGDFVVAWSMVTGGSAEIYARRFAADGTPLSGETLVNTSVTGNQWAPRIAMNADGAYVVTWLDQESAGGSLFHVRAQAFDGNGQRVGLQPALLDLTEQGGAFPRLGVTMDTDGDYTIAYTGFHAGPGTAYSIIGSSRFTLAGALLDDEHTVSGFGFVDAVQFGSIVTAGDARGNTAYVFTRRKGEGAQPEELYESHGPSGAPDVLDEVVGPAIDLYPKYQPSLGFAANGQAAVAWTMPDADATGVFVQRYSPQARPIGAALQINTYTTDTQQTPDVAIDANGDFVVAWESVSQEFGQYCSYGSCYPAPNAGIYAQRYRTAEAADLSVALRPGAGSVPAGQPASLGVVVVNHHAEAGDEFPAAVRNEIGRATGVRVRLRVPDSVTDVHSTTAGWTCALTERALFCDDPDPVPAGGRERLDVAYTPVAGGNLHFSVSVWATEPDPDDANNTAKRKVIAASPE